MRIRKIKSKIAEILSENRFEEALLRSLEIGGRKVISPLSSFFYSPEALTRHRASALFGELTAGFVEKDPEFARNLIRRLMWNLNDESGGIGWGSAEAMAESIARSRLLMDEYLRIFLSFIDPYGNYMENELLLGAVLWGIVKISDKWPEQVRPSGRLILPFLESADPFKRSMACRISGNIRFHPAGRLVRKLRKDGAEIRFFAEWKMTRRPVSYFAQKAAALL